MSSSFPALARWANEFRRSAAGIKTKESSDPYDNCIMNSSMPAFRAPTAGERAFNRIFGFLVGLGLGLPHNYLVQVRGRKSGRIYSTPIDLLELNGKRFLVAPRGRTQWVRNAEAAGEVRLKKGRTVLKFRLRALPDAEKPEILKAYLDRFRTTVQRYFLVPAGSPPEAFAELSQNYPVFELIPA
ncbi:MAG TPA: nitroreductase family deazaflavin-dependent oxidoreductase [Terriglobales bacterium]|nr:nitroreductase family deazaflavin-dependent oxidoreductase [Terriglobales bacterium]